MSIYHLVGAGAAARQEGHRRQVGARQLDRVWRHYAQPWLRIRQALSYEVNINFECRYRPSLKLCIYVV